MNRLAVIAFCALLLITNLSAAQDAAESPLLDMLARVPDTELVRGTAPVVSYVDYSAVSSMREVGLITETAIAERTDADSLWMAALMGVASGPDLSYWVVQIGAMDALVGFSWLDVQRAMVFGTPPSMGTLLEGDFEPDAITAAFTARGYNSFTEGDASILCPPDGCDTGQMLNLANRDPANPFGGHLGRSEPVALLPDGVIANSPNYDEMLVEILAAQSDNLASLADDPHYIAAVGAVERLGTLRQAQFFAPESVNSYGRTPGDPDAAAFGDLPDYRLFVLADTVADGQEITSLALVYDDAETAKSAAAVLDMRLPLVVSLARNQTLLDIVVERGGQPDAAYVVKVGDYSVVLLTIRNPLPSNTQQDVDGVMRFLPSGQIFQVFITGIYRRDLTLLSTEPG